MLSLLGLGFLIGLRHAFEADHAAAVATLATRSPSVAHTVKQGMVWGIGHTLTLLLFSSVVLLLESVIPDQYVQGLELAVGIMLVVLGVDVLHTLIKERIHFHVHQHHDRSPHLHAHSHREEPDHASSPHSHAHSEGFPYRALFVGCMHGMAGSAALILLTLHSSISLWEGLLYIAVFGLGSIAGMTVLSIVIALPLRYSARSLTWANNGLQGFIGVLSILLGLAMVLARGSNLLA